MRGWRTCYSIGHLSVLSRLLFGLDLGWRGWRWRRWGIVVVFEVGFDVCGVWVALVEH
jgi:hypothetical protein